MNPGSIDCRGATGDATPDTLARMTGSREPRQNPKTRRTRVEAVAAFMFFWTIVVGGWAAYEIAVGRPSVPLSFLLMVLVIVDVAIWRRWREMR